MTPKNITSPEQAEADRQTYRATCTMRRNGAVLERLGPNDWERDQGFKSINAAKHAVRTSAYGVTKPTYTV